MKTPIIIAGLLACVSVGCSTPSLNGLPPDRAVRADDVEGVWINDDTALVVEHDTGVIYKIKVTGSAIPATTRFYEFDGVLVADSSLDPDDMEGQDPMISVFTLPIHKFARIDAEGDTLRYADLRDEWVADNAERAWLADADDSNVLTPASGVLLRLLESAAADEDAWDDEAEFRRLSEED